MRHQLSGRQLSRNSPHRHAMLRNMSVSLLRHETIRTTVPKAKELRRVVEPLITLGKSDSDSHRRLAFCAPARSARSSRSSSPTSARAFVRAPGGYTRILRMMPRPGDSAPMALMQLVDGRRRRRRKGLRRRRRLRASAASQQRRRMRRRRSARQKSVQEESCGGMITIMIMDTITGMTTIMTMRRRGSARRSERLSDVRL